MFADDSEEVLQWKPDYFKNLNLLLNVNKTKVMNVDRLLSGVNLHRFGKVIVRDREIETVPSFKYLGFVIDNRLTFENLIFQCMKATNHKLYLL